MHGLVYLFAGKSQVPLQTYRLMFPPLPDAFTCFPTSEHLNAARDGVGGGLLGARIELAFMSTLFPRNLRVQKQTSLNPDRAPRETADSSSQKMWG